MMTKRLDSRARISSNLSLLLMCGTLSSYVNSLPQFPHLEMIMESSHGFFYKA